MQDHYLQNFV